MYQNPASARSRGLKRDLTIHVPNGSGDENKTSQPPPAPPAPPSQPPQQQPYDEPVPHHAMRTLDNILGEPVNIPTSTGQSLSSPPLQPSHQTKSSMPSIASTSPATPCFDRLTQLPTPVLLNGSFANYSHFQGSALSSPPRGNDSIMESIKSMLAVNNRVVSDYKPIARGHSLKSEKRIYSNPSEAHDVHDASSNSSTASSIASRDKERERERERVSGQGQGQGPVLGPVLGLDGRPLLLLLHTIDSPITPNTSPTLPQISKFSHRQFYSKRYDTTFTFVKEIGLGNFSNVVLAKNLNNGAGNSMGTVADAETISYKHNCGYGDEAAIKIITIPESKTQLTNFKSFILRELNILYHISHHPCITTLIDYQLTIDIDQLEIESETIPSTANSEPGFTKINEDMVIPLDRDQLLFMNYCHGGNLLSFLLQHNQQANLHNLTYWTYIRRIACELIVTAAYLHNHNVIHRDIKLENILLLYSPEEVNQILANDQIMATPFINLSDFGLSKKLDSPDQLLQTRCGSQDYISPEILMGLKYDGKLTDTWSIGVLVYSMLENKLPFDLQPAHVQYHQQHQQYQQNYQSQQQAGANTGSTAGAPSSNTGISPSVIKRRRSKKTSTAHRIAMIEWGWNDINYKLADKEISPEIKEILGQLKLFVDTVLVRKDRRPSVGQMLQMPEFSWLKECVPTAITEYNNQERT